jgi:hypothetical protein
MILRSLGGWTVEIILSLLERGVHESELFDFKERLPHPRNNSDKDRLVKACAAFANSEGGYLVFGVKDDRAIPARDRLTGIASSDDFPERFGNYPAQCSPSVVWNFKNPPLDLSPGKQVHIIELPASSRAPHSCGNAEEGWTFPKRTNKGTEFMSYGEGQTMFLGYHEKRIKLRLLRSELSQIIEDAQGLMIPQEKIETHYGQGGFTLGVLETVLADTYSILASSPDLLATMSKLRSFVGTVNAEMDRWQAQAVIPMSNKPALARAHNEFVMPRCERIADAAAEAVGLLDQIIG